MVAAGTHDPVGAPIAGADKVGLINTTAPNTAANQMTDLFMNPPGFWTQLPA
jgi:hypothetical protein